MKKWLLLCAALAVLLAGWRPAAKEPEGLALVRVLGVDGPGPVRLSAVCGGEDQGDQSRGSCAGADFGQALAGLPWSGEEELSLTSVSYIIVGRDVELRAGLLCGLPTGVRGAAATFGLAEDGASAVRAGCADPASGLDLLTRKGSGAPTAAEALAKLERGEGLTLPLLAGDGPVLIDWEEWRTAP